MRSSRSSFLALGGIALFSGLLALASTTLAPTTAQACPESEGACPCGQACPSEHAAGNCAGDDKAGGCAGKDEKGAACACPPGEDGNCACGAECGSKHGGDCKAAGAAEKKPGACGCGGAGAAGADAAEKAAGCGGQEGAAQQRAVIDPATGQLVVPDKNSAAAPTANDVATHAEGAASAGASTAHQMAVPGAGVIAAFPKDRASHAVATVDKAGETHTGCEHGAE